MVFFKKLKVFCIMIKIFWILNHYYSPLAVKLTLCMTRNISHGALNSVIVKLKMYFGIIWSLTHKIVLKKKFGVYHILFWLQGLLVQEDC